MKFVVSSIVLILGFTASLSSVAHAGLSAARAPGTSYESYLREAQDISIFRHFFGGDTVLDKKGLFTDADWARVPEITAVDMQASFESARDVKPFDDRYSSRKMKRRASWLFPDDGCFVRAVIAADTIEQQLGVKSAKIFAFGDLTVKTVNSIRGSVDWWYHVAAIAKVIESGREKFYVYDPAIDPKKPMEVHDWLTAMNSPDADIAICSGDSYDPDSECGNGDPTSMKRAHNEAPGYLSSEWVQLQQLGRDPARELGDFPPWL